MPVWRTRCLRAGAWLFAALYAAILLLVLFRNTAFGYNPALQLALMAVWAGVLAAALRLWRRCGGWCRRHKYRVLAAALAFVFAVQLAVGAGTIPTPIYDNGSVFFGAVTYAAQGEGGADFTPYAAYLRLFPNNAGLFLLLQALFRALHTVGLNAEYQAALLIGHLLFTVALAAGFLYLDAAFGTDTAFAGLLAALLYLPLYFQSSVPYTDTWSLWCVPCVLLCAQRSRAAAGPQGRLGWAALGGVFLGLGAQVKVTVLIVAIALVAGLLLEGRLRQAGAALLAALLLAAGVHAGFEAWGRTSGVWGPEYKEAAMPTTYWLMTGLAGDGGYNTIDGQSKPDEQTGGSALARQQWAVIRERLQEMGPAGYLRLLLRKTCRSFGSGEADLGYSYLYAEPSQPVNWVYRLILRNGQYFPVFNNLAHSFYLMLLALGVLGAARAAYRGGTLCREGFPLYLALVGFWMFMMLWESNHRQLINQWPLLWMAAGIGLAGLRRGAQAE